MLPDLSRDEILRYARHLVLPEVGMEGQRRLKASSALLVGAGGLGSPAALYLAAAGVGTIGLADFDAVDASNLQRQILHGTSDIGRPKLESAERRLADVNPHVDVVRHETRLSAADALDVLAPYDVVVDGTDNFPTRYLVNDACVLLGKPNVYGSIFRWEGQVSVFGAPAGAGGDGEARGPCYRCLFREPPPPGLVPDCAEGGVLGVLPGIIGSLQALETLKLLLGRGDALVGRLLVFDALDLSFREVRIRRNPDCPVCGDEPTQTGLIDYEVFCGVAAAGEASARAAGERGPVPEIGARELADRLGAGGRPYLLDVREPWEWALGSLQDRGARLIPLGELERRLGEVPSDRDVVVYCRTGARSARAVEMLAGEGIGSAYNLRGGLTAWKAEVDPDLTVA